MLKVTAAIITKNRPQLLFKCLESLKRQTSNPDEIIVIENGPILKSKNVCDTFSKYLSVNYFYEPVASIPKTRNMCLQKASSDIIAFIDDDCEADEKWIENIRIVHEKLLNVVAIQGKKDTKQKNVLAQTVTFQAMVYTREGYLDTANLSLKRKSVDLHKIKFDENFNLSSDAELGLQIESKMQKIYFSDNILVYHTYDLSFIKFLNKYFSYGKIQTKLKLKHRYNIIEPSRFNKFNKLVIESDNRLFTKLAIILLNIISRFVLYLGAFRAYFGLFLKK